MTSSPYQAALDDIYATFMRVKHLNKGRFDRDARQPQRLLAIARARGILPPPERTIKVSGSKGKGTTARIAAQMLQTELPTAKIGLFVSPEEDDHNDRMRINGVMITRERFVHHYERLKPQLLQAEAELTGPDYLSPLGIFLLVALDWFYSEGVDYFVLETGRGVSHDEVGQIPSKVGILNSARRLLILHGISCRCATPQDLSSPHLKLQQPPYKYQISSKSSHVPLAITNCRNGST
jgi:folylpolyglutamate synthase/dihydropteroate synthase